MTSLKYSRKEIKQISQESFFNSRVSSFWRDYAIATNQRVGEWDGRDSFIIELSLDHSNQKDIQKFSLSQSIKKIMNGRFEELFDLIDEELLEIKSTDKQYLRINKINSIIKETEKAIDELNIGEKYRNILLKNFSSNREKFLERYDHILRASPEVVGLLNGFIYENLNKNYEDFKSFFMALKGNYLIPKTAKIGELSAIFRGEPVNKIEWLGDAKETDCFFKALKKNKRVRVKGGIWKAVENNFLVKNSYGELISSVQMRSLDVFDDRISKDRDRKKQIRSIVDIL